MKMIPLRILVILAGLLIGSKALAAPPASQPGYSDEQLRRLVGQLNDPSYRLRQQASKELARLDPHQIGRLVPFYQNSTQPEERFRLRQAAKAIFLAGKRSSLPPEGFLGVQNKQTIRTAQNGDKNLVAEIISVVPGSPADQAGLKTSDQIVTLFGQPLSGEPGETFPEKVRRMAPGDPVKLRVLRGAEKLDLLVTLGDRAKADLAEDAPAEWVSQFRQLWGDKFDFDEPLDGPAP